MEPTIVIALITALAAIVSPVITAKMNNSHNLKLREMEFKNEKLKNVNLHEREVLESALAGIGNLMSWQDAESIKESCKNIIKAIAYVDWGTGERLMGIVNSVMNEGKKKSLEELIDICEDLKMEIAKRVE